MVAVGGAPTRLAALSKGVIHASTFIPPQDIAAEKTRSCTSSSI